MAESIPGSSLAIVAIPKESDYVWKISSEKVPHLTLCFLGDQSNNPNLGRMAEFLEHVANTSMHKFGMNVERRGTLGDKNADVLFFDEHNKKFLDDIRSFLLKDRDIAEAYNSTEQYPEWTPHLTLGFPETPAKPDNREYPGIQWVTFDRIALWTGDYEGPTFQLNNDGEMAMSEKVEDFLEHFGVKGMKWGVRKDIGTSAGETRADKKWAKKAGRLSNLAKAYNATADRMNKVELSRINNKPQYKNKDFNQDSPLRRKYYKEVGDTFEKILHEESLKVIGTNPSGTKRLRYYMDENNNVTYRFEDIQHADGDAVFVSKMDNGYIVGIELVETSMAQVDEDHELLIHFGVKGMKWGFRKKRSTEHDSEDATAAAEAAKKVKKHGTSSLTNKELQQLVNRMNLEQQYARLIPDTKKKAAAKFAREILVDVGKEQTKKLVRDAATKQFAKLLASRG